MRILQVVHGFPPINTAGTEIYTYMLCKEMSKYHEIHVFYPIYGNEPYFLRHSVKEGLNVHELCLSESITEKVRRNIFFKNTYRNEIVERKFEELLDNITPDIIHFQHLINLSAALIEIAKKKGIPSVLTLHDYWFICPSVQLLRDDYSICSGPNENASNCFECWNNTQARYITNYLFKFGNPLLMRTFEEFFRFFLKSLNEKGDFLKRKKYMKKLLFKVDKLIAPSKFLKKFFVKYGIPSNQIVYLNNGYNLNLIKDVKKKKKNKIVFGFVGALAKHKGVDIAINAFNKIKTYNAELKIYGNVNTRSKYFKELSKTIKNPNIKLVGKFKHIKEPYSEIDILIFPSIWYENCPLVILEAFITKTPIIASNIGALPEFIKNKENGLLFKVGNSNDLNEKINLIIDNPHLISRFKQNIPSVKTISKHVKELETIYIELRKK